MISYADRVQETTTTTGTGALTLAGPTTGNQSFVSGIDNTVLGAKISTTTTDYYQGWIVEIQDIADWRGAAAINSIQSPLMKTYAIT
jgi:hypothetical protein